MSGIEAAPDGCRQSWSSWARKVCAVPASAAGRGRRSSRPADAATSSAATSSTGAAMTAARAAIGAASSMLSTGRRWWRTLATVPPARWAVQTTSTREPIEIQPEGQTPVGASIITGRQPGGTPSVTCRGATSTVAMIGHGNGSSADRPVSSRWPTTKGWCSAATNKPSAQLEGMGRIRRSASASTVPAARSREAVRTAVVAWREDMRRRRFSSHSPDDATIARAAASSARRRPSSGSPRHSPIMARSRVRPVSRARRQTLRSPSERAVMARVRGRTRPDRPRSRPACEDSAEPPKGPPKRRP